jgi:hypothetical protein
MHGPLIRAGGTETIARQIGAFPDAQAGVAKQQKNIPGQIVTAQKFLLQKPVLFGGQRTRKPLGAARHVLAADQVGQFGKLPGPGQFLKDAAQAD